MGGLQVTRRRKAITVTLDEEVLACLTQGAYGAMMPVSRFLEHILIDHSRNHPEYYQRKAFSIRERNHDDDGDK